MGLNIVAKIWLSIGVFVLGFVLATVSGQVQSRTTERALRSASEALFPAAQQSQDAESAFQQSMKGFSDAVVMQDSGGLERAAEDGQQVVARLKAVAAIRDLPASRSSEAAKLAASTAQFLADAHDT